MMCWIVQIQCKVSVRWVPSSKFLFIHILPFVNTSHRWISYRFVSRAMPRDTRNHVILGLQQFKPTEFAQQMNLNMENAWGILRCILDIIKKLDDGKYLIMRDPNKVRLANLSAVASFLGCDWWTLSVQILQSSLENSSLIIIPQYSIRSKFLKNAKKCKKIMIISWLECVLYS